MGILQQGGRKRMARFLLSVVFLGLALGTADGGLYAVELLHPVTATQSSTYQEVGAYDGTEFPASKCINGAIEGHSLVDRNMCHTQNEPTPWLAIDYGTLQLINRVEIFNREACCGERTKNIDVRVSDELPTSANEVHWGFSPWPLCW